MGKRKKDVALNVLSREKYLWERARSKEPLNIRLTNDYAFRKVFRNKFVLKGFLMALLHLKEEEIVEIEVTDPHEEGESADEKEGILDIKILLNNNRRINLEMQNHYQPDWPERSVFYNSRMYVEGYISGTMYGDMEPCIQVGILNFNLMKSRGFHHKMMLTDQKTGEIYSDKFAIHVIELKKLDETPEEEQDELYRWAKLIAACDWEMVEMTAKGNPYMEEAMSEMKQINMSETERYLYLRRSMARSDEASRLHYATQQGIQKGIQQGREEGIQQGREEGIQQGREDAIRNLIEDNLEENKEECAIIQKLMKRFELSEEKAKEYFEKFRI